MPPEPLVSVVLAVHDGAPTLASAVDSVLRQTLHELELIVVDDCSGDGTPDLLAAVADDRLVVLRNEEQLGLAASLNRGLERASGRYVARLDADDVALPRRLERQVAAMRPGLAVLGSSVLELDVRGRPGRLHPMPLGTAAVRWHLLFSSPFFHPSVLLDRELLVAHGLRYDPAYLESEDYDLWARTLAVADGDNVAEPLLLYRRHSGQASERRRDVQRDFQRRVALREIARVAPALAAADAELAWSLGSGEYVPDGRLRDAGEAFAELLRSFERGRPDRGVRQAAARVLARTADARLVSLALKLDPALPVRAASRRGRRRALERSAQRDAYGWLRALSDGPVRVAAVFAEPAPYRSPLLDRLAARPELDLTVLYAGANVARRTWAVDLSHPHVVLRGLRVPGLRRLLRHDYPVTPGVWRELDRIAPDVVVAQGWSTFAAQAAVVWARRRRVPYVLQTESNERDPRPAWRRGVKALVVTPLVRAAGGVLVTGSLAREAMERRGAAPDRIRVFAATVDVGAFAERVVEQGRRRTELRAALELGVDDVAVLCAARLVPEKDHATLVRAIALAGDFRLALVVAGEGPERARLERLASDLGVRAVFAGDVPWERIHELYAAADVFALLSKHEPWGVVVIEAAASRLPLLLSDAVGAAHDLVRPGENGEIVPAGDAAAAAEALRRLAADPELRSRQGEVSRGLAAGWGYGPSVEGFLDLVQLAARTSAP